MDTYNEDFLAVIAREWPSDEMNRGSYPIPTDIDTEAPLDEGFPDLAASTSPLRPWTLVRSKRALLRVRPVGLGSHPRLKLCAATACGRVGYLVRRSHSLLRDIA